MSTGGKHRPAPPDDGIDLTAVAKAALDMRLLQSTVEEMADKPRCSCGQAVATVRPDGVLVPCPAPGCPTLKGAVAVQVLTFTGKDWKVAYVRRGARLPGGALLYWWESEPAATRSTQEQTCPRT